MNFLNAVLAIAGLLLSTACVSASEPNKYDDGHIQSPSCSSSGISYGKFSHADQIAMTARESSTWQITEFLTQLSVTGENLERLVSIIEDVAPVSKSPKSDNIFSTLSYENRADLACIVAGTVLAGQGHITEDGMVDYTLKSRVNW